MPIEFKCNCGRRLRMADEHAGKLARCPACKAVVAVPKAQPDDWDLRIVEESPPPHSVKADGAPDPGKVEETPPPQSAKADASPPEPVATDCELEIVEEEHQAVEPAEEDYGLEVVEETPPAAAAPVTAAPIAVPAPAGAAPVAVAVPVTGPAGEVSAPEPVPAEVPKKKRKKRRTPEKETGLTAMYMDQARAQLREDDERRARLAKDDNEGLTLFNVHITRGVVAGASGLGCGLLALVFVGFCGVLGVWGPNLLRLLVLGVVGILAGVVTLFRALFLGTEE